MEDIHFKLYSRSYCHLCNDMLEQLERLRSGHAFQLTVIDIDDQADSTALAAYDELVPVLLGRRGDRAWTKLCHYHLDLPVLETFLTSV